MAQVTFPVFNADGGLRKLPGPGCLAMFSNAINPEAQNNINAFNAFIQRSNQPSFFISDATWKMLCDGENHKGKWLPEDHEVYGFVFCLALKKWEVLEERISEKSRYFGYAYFRIRTILKKKGTDLNGVNDFEAYVEEENIAYADVAEALQDNSVSNEDQVKFLTPSDFLLREIINKEVVKKGDEAHLKNTFFGGIATEVDRETKGEIKGIFSNEGGIFGIERLEEIRTGKGTRVSIARRIRPYDEEKDKEEGMPDLSRREIYYHFKINPEYETDLPCPMPQVC
ncbi:hypothetical protein [Leadbetterella sp. DM7]|uniref:hypothetical protein n=1 Tax=Leadbetterella sp. DM7 TaxID=3235085 RepID=UPI00349E4D22